MIRVLAFLLSVVCCAGLISGAYTAIADTGDEVTFTETVKFGDPAVMDGRTARFGVACGDHIQWRFAYHFGPEDSHDTEFVFSQDDLISFLPAEPEVLQVYGHSGVGMSTSGGEGVIVSSGGYGDMIRTVAALTLDGEEFEMKLKLADYLDYHDLNFEINYYSDRYVCQEYVDMFHAMTGTEPVDSPSYDGLMELFKFPVQEDQIVSIQVGKNLRGNITSLYYNSEGDISINMVNAATDEGIYCIPVYFASNDSPEVIPGEYALGSGVYFIPWTVYDNGYQYAGGRQAVKLDTDNAQNIYPLPEDTIVYDLKLDEQTRTAWMLSLEDGRYVLTRLDLTGQKVLDRLELMACDPENGSAYPNWYVRDGLMVVHDRNQLALVTTGAEPELAFTVPVGQTRDGLYYITEKQCDLLYEDGVLYLADATYFNADLNVIAFDKTGPLYWGQYTCSLFECDAQGGSPYLQTLYAQTELE